MNSKEIEQREYNTWLVRVNLNNIKTNYDTIITDGHAILRLPDDELKTFLKTQISYHDKINWSNVDIEKIREEIVDILE